MPESRAQHKPGEVCPRCQFVHLTPQGAPACVGHRKGNKPSECSLRAQHKIGHPGCPECHHGDDCTKSPVNGQNICLTHGAGAPQNREAAARRIASQQVSAALGRLEVPLGADADPREVLMQQLVLATLWELVVREQVAELDPAELTERYGVALHEIWIAARDRAVDIAATCLKAGFEERNVRVMEQQAVIFADLMRKVVDDPKLGLDEAQRQNARRIAAGHIRLVAGG